jgi:hypothetical protein
MASLILRLDVGDQVIDRSTLILQQQKGWDVITPNSNLSKLGNVGRGETLIINGHGDPVSLGGYSTSGLAALLAQGGLRGPVEIQLIACETGWGGAPFALELKVALVQGQKIMCSVSAPTHFVSVQNDGSLYVDKDVVGAGGQLIPQAVPANKAFYGTTKAF